MPEISVLPAIPAASVAPVSAAPAPQAASTTADPAAGAVASFLNQLQAALGSLGLLPQPQAGPAPQVPADTLEAPAEDDTKGPDTSDAMPEMLAALGFVPVPAMLPVLTTTVAAEATPERTAAPAAPIAPGTVASTLAPAPTPASAPSAGTTSPADQPQPVQTSADATQPDATQQLPAPADQAAPAPIELPKDMPAPQPQPQPQPQTMPQQVLPMSLQQPAQRAEPAASSRAHVGKTTATSELGVMTATPQASQPIAMPMQHDGTGDSGTPDGDSDDASTTSTTEPVQSKGDAPVTNFANVAAATPTHVQAPADVRPSQVVGQIAHQAELYRLPGGRGVRIQLHPDDLGGVGVTIKYGATGGLELHMNVEHTATAELVQAGWNDLRDALSLQGISADRLVMSVSGPGDASFSGGSSESGSSYRSDTSQTGFTDGGQQQREEPRSSSSRGWSGPDIAPVGGADEPAMAQSASNSRIDYRA